GLRNSKANTRGGGKKVATATPIHAQAICPKCGAVRTDRQIGLEPTLCEFIETIVEVCAEIHRVLKPTGTFWLNIGDCYATEPNGRSATATKAAGNDDRTFRDKPFATFGPIGDAGGARLKPKDLCMVANRVAIALQEWG